MPAKRELMALSRALGVGLAACITPKNRTMKMGAYRWERTGNTDNFTEFSWGKNNGQERDGKCKRIRGQVLWLEKEMKKIDMKVALKNSQQILGKWMGRE